MKSAEVHTRKNENKSESEFWTLKNQNGHQNGSRVWKDEGYKAKVEGCSLSCLYENSKRVPNEVEEGRQGCNDRDVGTRFSPPTPARHPA